MEAAAAPLISKKHLPCGQKCSRDLLCGHACGKSCHGGSTCPPCTQACAAQCVHGRCKASCTEPCAPCAEACTWQCQHQVCSSPHICAMLSMHHTSMRTSKPAVSLFVNTGGLVLQRLSCPCTEQPSKYCWQSQQTPAAWCSNAIVGS